MRPPLLCDVRCDIVVVGGGITGSLVALELTRRSQHVVVLDGAMSAAGATSAGSVHPHALGLRCRRFLPDD